MPGRDRSGPLGEGRMSGRGAGFCGESTGAGRAMRVVPAYGFGRGGSFGRGRGLGRGYRARYWMQTGPEWRSEPDLAPLDQAEETRLLRTEAEHMRSTLEAIERRLEQLEST